MKYKELFENLVEKEIKQMEKDYERIKYKDGMFDLEKHRLNERIEFYSKVLIYLKFGEDDTKNVSPE